MIVFICYCSNHRADKTQLLVGAADKITGKGVAILPLA
jgi:hypothetical protein